MTHYARVGDDGQVVLSAEVAREIGLSPGDLVIIDRVDGRMSIRTYEDIVREGQDRFRALMPAGFSGSLVDELIADRRSEADRE